MFRPDETNQRDSAMGDVCFQELRRAWQHQPGSGAVDTLADQSGDSPEIAQLKAMLADVGQTAAVQGRSDPAIVELPNTTLAAPVDIESEWFERAKAAVETGIPPIDIACIPSTPMGLSGRGYKLSSAEAETSNQKQTIDLFWLWTRHQISPKAALKSARADHGALFRSIDFDWQLAHKIAVEGGRVKTKVRALGLTKRQQIECRVLRQDEIHNLTRGVMDDANYRRGYIQEYLESSLRNRDARRPADEQAEELVTAYRALRFSKYTDASAKSWLANAADWFRLLARQDTNAKKMGRFRDRLEKIFAAVDLSPNWDVIPRSRRTLSEVSDEIQDKSRAQEQI